jgi:hypothetical protein
MHEVVELLATLGAWLLVAGPIYQAALELREQDFDRERFTTVTASVAPAPKISPWWWLLPPVAYVLRVRAVRAQRRAIMEALTPEQLEQMLGFINKATGWLIVASGAFLLAFAQTWALRDLFGWPIVVFWVLVVVLLLLCVGYVTSRMLVTNQALHPGTQTSKYSRRHGSASTSKDQTQVAKP